MVAKGLLRWSGVSCGTAGWHPWTHATAADGKEGVDKYKELCPNVDLVTMDITMPKMDGITALEQIMAFDKNAKVVMVSALGKEELVKKSLMTGAKSYIIKPLDRKKVLERIAKVLQ